MTRVLAGALAVLLLAAPADADVLSTATDAWSRLQRFLYPPRPAGVVPVPAPRPAAAPAAPAVEAPARAAAPAQAPAAAAAPARPARAPRATQKPKPKAARDDGPDLPWPCWTIRLFAAGKSPAELERMGRERGVTLTPKQRRQARACLR